MTNTSTTANDTFVEVAGGRVQVMSGGSGDPLVLLHSDIGYTEWMPFHDELAKSFSVTVPAHGGYGKSDRPEWARSVRDLAILQRQTITALGIDNYHLVGLGYGGWIAAELATMVSSGLRSLTLVNPAGIRPTEGKIYDQFMVSAVEHVRHGFADQAKFDALFGAEPELDLLEQWEINREMTTRVGWSPYMYNLTLPPLLDAVSIPALIVRAEQDDVMPASSVNQYLDHLKNAQLKTLPDAGHFPDFEQPAALAALITDFASKA